MLRSNNSQTKMMKMRLTLLVLISFIGFNTAFSQIVSPVKWSYTTKHISGDQYDLIATAVINDGYYIYSQHIKGDGPIPTFFEFDETDGVTFVGKVNESGPKKKTEFDNTFEINLTKFYKKAYFKQRVKVSKSGTIVINGGREFMTCNASNCLPPTYDRIKFTLKAKKQKPKNNTIVKTETPKPTIPVKPVVGTTTPDKGTVVNSAGLPVNWTVEGIRVNREEYDVIFTAKVKDGWELYPNYIPNSKGPMPTTFEFENYDDRIEISKRAKAEGTRISTYDKHYKMKLTRYQDEVTFTQRIKIEKGSRKVNGDIYYVASQETGTIPPYRVRFNINLPKKITPTEAELKKQEREAAKRAAELAAKQAEEDATNEEETADEVAVEATDVATTEVSGSTSDDIRYQGDKFDYSNIEEDCTGVVQEDSQNPWWIFLLGFGGGLLALLTPCVFPMIPITVSFFTKRSKTRVEGIKNSIIYGLSIIAIYVSLGLIVTGIFGPEALNKMSTSVFFNLLFFAVFVIFAFSFFGFYEIQLPNSWVSKSDQAADRGGLIGIFFMAFTLSLVSFSCTGPIIGTLLVQAATSNTVSLFGFIPLNPMMGMLGFSTALALPFALFAAFPGWLNSLPKSGGWMNTVKVTLGFLELALALKFLSVADMTNHWGILPIEIFLGIWIAIFLGLAAYLFGFIKFPHDSPTVNLTKGRFVTGMASLAFVFYLFTGFSYKPLKLLSGLAPPTRYNLFQDKEAQEYPDCPNGIRCFKDYDEALAFAREIDKPLMVDFTGHGCVNCRKVEENVWIDKTVKEMLSNDYVLVSLYVDDRKEYKNKEGENFRNVGAKWAQFQIEHFGSNTQPLYVLVDTNEKVLRSPINYNTAKSVDNFVEFLECGLQQRQQLSEK